VNVGKFDADAKCPKCGFDTINTSFCPGTYPSKEIVAVSDDGNEVMMPLSGNLCPVGLVDPHLHRGCQRCGFLWPERTLDDDSKGGMKEASEIAKEPAKQG
jgi:hypothetical protein